MTTSTKANARRKTAEGTIFVAYHKPYSILKGDFITPVHAGRSCAVANKDSNTPSDSHDTFFRNMVGDDTGVNISSRNNEFNECSVLYWIWKNADIKNLKYIGFFQYRRHLILNEYFENSKDDIEKSAYRCTHFKKITSNYDDIIGLNEKNILNILKDYDCILPLSTDFTAINTTSVYDDWVYNIPGVHVDDLIELENVIAKLHPEMSDDLCKYLNSPKKRMYHIFITKPSIFNEYCDWLFNILFELDKRIDTSLYSVNGKRTLGYLAETLYGFYFSYKKNEIKIKECGVAFIDK